MIYIFISLFLLINSTFNYIITNFNNIKCQYLVSFSSNYTIYSTDNEEFYINYIYGKLKKHPIKPLAPQNITLNKDKVKISKNKPSSYQKKIYLTFDDGPSNLTLKVLKVLDEHQVKATFFVIGSKCKTYPQVILKIKEGGHSIGLHSYSHNYSYIYSSYENFYNEMKKSQEIIKVITGDEINIIRFPGGSYRRLNKDFYTLLNELNFKIYDWNLSCGDGTSPTPSVEKMFIYSTKDSNKYSDIILLMHSRDTDHNTLEALPRIIEYYKNKGYKFDIITKETPEYIFPFK